MALIASGLTNRAIADRAYLSINSVKTFIRAAYRQIGVKSRTQAVIWALENGFRPDTVRTVFPALDHREAGPPSIRSSTNGELVDQFS